MINETESKDVTFTLNKRSEPEVFYNKKAIPIIDSVKYLGLNLDERLTWKTHIKNKIKQINRSRAL